MPPLPRPERTLASDARGAVYVEFLIAFMPVFVFFLCLLQLSLLFSAKLVVAHGATQGARTAAVVFGDEPGPYGAGSSPHAMSRERRRTVRDSVLVALSPMVLDDTIGSVGVSFPPAGEPGGKDPGPGAQLSPMNDAGTTMVRVRVEALVVCKLAIAKVIACKRLGNSTTYGHTVAVESLFPYQGASYVYE